tara:strand:+ start:4042 stop:4242 length:201 start_codon:yes stop_codon:yes gene_type:complete
MIIELSEYQASILQSSIGQTIITMREDKFKVTLASSLAIETGVREYEKLKEHLISSWKKDLQKEIF